MEKYTLPRMLLIAGTGRNSGKTTLGCRLLEAWKDKEEIHTIKITPHMHRGDISGRILEETDNFIVAEELTADQNKDSRRYLQAGAARSFLVMAKDEFLGEALAPVFYGCRDDQVWICESAGARRWIKPGLFLMVSTDWSAVYNAEVEHNRGLADGKLEMNRDSFNMPLELIQIDTKGWRLEKEI